MTAKGKSPRTFPQFFLRELVFAAERNNRLNAAFMARLNRAIQRKAGGKRP